MAVSKLVDGTVPSKKVPKAKKTPKKPNGNSHTPTETSQETEAPEALEALTKMGAPQALLDDLEDLTKTEVPQAILDEMEAEKTPIDPNIAALMAQVEALTNRLNATEKQRSLEANEIPWARVPRDDQGYLIFKHADQEVLPSKRPDLCADPMVVWNGTHWTVNSRGRLKDMRIV